MSKQQLVEIPESKSAKEQKEIERMKRYQALEESMNSVKKKIKHYITIKVLGIRYNENESEAGLRFCAHGRFGEWDILVPARIMNFGVNEEDKENWQLENMYRNYINATVGANIDVVIMGVDSVKKIAVGNREMAMNYLTTINYFKSDESGYSRMERIFRDKKTVECRVVSVKQSFAFLDIQGYMSRIHVSEIGWRYLEDARDLIESGDVVQIKIKELDIDKVNRIIRVEPSMRMAMANTVKENCRRYHENDSVTGYVTRVDDNNYFIQVGDFRTGIDILSKIVKCPELPEVGDTVLVTIGTINEEQGRVFGVVERIIKKRDKRLNI